MTRGTLKFLSELLDRVTIGASDPEFEQLAAAISLARRELNQALDAGDITRAEPEGPLPLAPAAPDEQPAAVLAVLPPEPTPAACSGRVQTEGGEFPCDRPAFHGGVHSYHGMVSAPLAAIRAISPEPA